MTRGRVTYEKADGVGRITFDNPAAYNALSWDMWRTLGEACREIAADREVRVVVLRGAGGKAFVSGTDIEGFRDLTTGEQGVAYEREMDGYVGAVEALPQPTVAVVEGYAVGGGLALAFACDFRIATPGARFGSPLARTIGNCLSAKGYARLVAHLGVAQTKRMLLLAELVGAEELSNLGLLTEVATREALDDAVQALCDRLKANAPLTQGVSKAALSRTVYAGLPDIDDLIRIVYGSHDFRKGVESFLSKARPAWRGE